jgi:hypothetical protein
MNNGQKVDKKYKKSLKEFDKKLEIFEDDLDKKYHSLFLLKLGNQNGVFCNLCKNLSAEIAFEILDKNEKSQFLQKNVLNWVKALIEEKIFKYVIECNSKDFPKLKFSADKDSDKIAQKKIALDSLLFKNLQKQTKIFHINCKSAAFALILNNFSKRVFSIRQQVLRECFYFTRQSILDIEEQISKNKKDAINDNQKEKIKVAKKFLKKLTKDQLLNEKNLEYGSTLPVLKKIQFN